MKRLLTYTADRDCVLAVTALREIVKDLDALGVGYGARVSAAVRPDRAGGNSGRLRVLKIETNR